MNTRKSVSLFGENLDEGMHICTFFRTSAEKYRVLMPFIREGMEQGDRAFHIVNPSLRSEHAQRIAEAGIDAARAEGEGQLAYLTSAPEIPAVLSEIGRLRELTFRAAGEGTGKSIDLGWIRTSRKGCSRVRAAAFTR